MRVRFPPSCIVPGEAWRGWARRGKARQGEVQPGKTGTWRSLFLEVKMMDELIPFERLEMVAKSIDLYPVDFDDAWQWVGYSRKDNALETLKANFEEGTDFSGLKRKSTGGRPSDAYFLTTDCFKAFCMMAGTQKGKEVRRYYLDLEKKYLSLVQETRLSKLVRRDFTDAIQASGLNVTMHGFAFKQFTDLINKAVLGMEARKYREINKLPKDANIREHVTPVQRASIAKIERLVGAAVEVGADYYKVKEMIVDMGIGKAVSPWLITGSYCY
jgi:phage anti-repressor protein